MEDAEFNSPAIALANPSSRFPIDHLSVQRPPGKGPITLAVTVAVTCPPASNPGGLDYLWPGRAEPCRFHPDAVGSIP
jgi:hypothetical protein